MRSKVKDLMTSKVVTVRRSAPYKEIVQALRDAGVSAVPVVDDTDRLVGIISEADLLLKEEHVEGEHRRKGFGKARIERQKAAAAVAEEMMTAPVFTIEPDAPIAEAARAMHAHAVKRLPVIDESGKVIGILSRRDLLRVFLRPDDEIRKEVAEDLMVRKMWLSPDEAHVNVDVKDGVVIFQGKVDRKSLMDILVALTLGIEGVVTVENYATYEIDDTRMRPEIPPPWGVLPYGLRRP